MLRLANGAVFVKKIFRMVAPQNPPPAPSAVPPSVCFPFLKKIHARAEMVVEMNAALAAMPCFAREHIASESEQLEAEHVNE